MKTFDQVKDAVRKQLAAQKTEQLRGALGWAGPDYTLGSTSP